jgi:hypothetical protein
VVLELVVSIWGLELLTIRNESITKCHKGVGVWKILKWFLDRMRLYGLDLSGVGY